VKVESDATCASVEAERFPDPLAERE